MATAMATAGRGAAAAIIPTARTAPIRALPRTAGTWTTRATSSCRAITERASDSADATPQNWLCGRHDREADRGPRPWPAGVLVYALASARAVIVIRGGHWLLIC